MADAMAEKLNLMSEQLTIPKFIQHFSSKFPLIIVTDREFRGNGFFQHIPAGQLLLVSHVVSRPRLYLQNKTHVISVPESFPIRLKLINKIGLVIRTTTVCEFMSDKAKKKLQKVAFETEPRGLMVSSSGHFSASLGTLTFQRICMEHFLVVHPFKNGVINFNPTALSVEASVTVQIAEGHDDMPASDWSDLLQKCALALRETSEVEPPELKKMFVYEYAPPSHHPPPRPPPPTKGIIKGYSQQPYAPSTQNRSHIHYQAEAFRGGQIRFEDLKNIRLVDSVDGRIHKTNATTDSGSAKPPAIALQGYDAVKVNGVHFKEPAELKGRPKTNYYSKYYSKNEPPQNQRTGHHNQVPRADYNRLVVYNGHHLNIDQKGPKAVNRMSSRNESTLEARNSVEIRRNVSNGRSGQRVTRADGKHVQSDSNDEYRDVIESRFMKISDSEDDGICNDEVFQDLKLNRTVDDIPIGKSLQVQPSNSHFLEAKVQPQQRAHSTTRILSSSKSGRFFSDDSEDADNESQATVIYKTPRSRQEEFRGIHVTDSDKRIAVKAKTRGFELRENVPSNAKMYNRKDGRRYGEVPDRLSHADNHVIVPRYTNYREGHDRSYLLQQREVFPNRASAGQEFLGAYVHPSYIANKKYPRRPKYSSDADFSGSEDIPRQRIVSYSYVDTLYLPKMKANKISAEKSYIINGHDVLRGRPAKDRDSFDVYQGSHRVHDNRNSISSSVNENNFDEIQAHRRSHGMVESKSRTRSASQLSTRVYVVNRNGRLMSREIPVSFIQSPPPTPVAKTLISVNNDSTHALSPAKRLEKEQQQGIYRQVINVR